MYMRGRDSHHTLRVVIGMRARACDAWRSGDARCSWQAGGRQGRCGQGQT